MSSVRDRIRHLQQQPDDSIDASGKASSVVQLAKTLESTSPKGDSLVSRVARFDAAATAITATRPVQKGIPSSRSLIQPAPTSATPLGRTNASAFPDGEKPPVARHIASDNEDGRVASRVRATDAALITAHDNVDNARRIFEAHQQQMQQKQSGDIDDNKKASIFSRAAAFETKPTTPNALSKSAKNALNEDGVASRAAIFDHRKGPELMTKNNNSSIGKSDTSRSDPNGAQSIHEQPKKFEEKSLLDQVNEVTALNNKLIKSLLDLTEEFRRLEQSRDSLQKRIAELEAAAK